MDIYATITDRIIEQMEEGLPPWQKPWISTGNAVSHTTGKAYSLLNQMLLGRPGEYATFRQIQQAGGRVRKGEKSQMIVFWKWLAVKDEDTDEEIEIPMLRYYNVFHIDQCEGLTAKHVHPLPDTASADQTAEAIITDYIKRSGVKLDPPLSRLTREISKIQYCFARRFLLWERRASLCSEFGFVLLDTLVFGNGV